MRYVECLNPFVGHKADKEVSSLGRPACAAQCSAELAIAMRAPPKGCRWRGGSASSATCNTYARRGEIFQIAVIMNGLVLIGSVSPSGSCVLLRVEEQE